VEGCCAPFRGGAASTSNTMWPGRWPTSAPSGILVRPAVWPQQTWAVNWVVVSPFLGAAVSPSKTMWPGARPTSIPSGILVHPTVWPQYTNVTDRQTDRQDRQRSDSTGRTVLETVAQNHKNTTAHNRMLHSLRVLECLSMIFSQSMFGWVGLLLCIMHKTCH